MTVVATEAHAAAQRAAQPVAQPAARPAAPRLARAVMPRESHDWTVDDLDAIPEDGLQHELLDGILLVSPAPVPLHQRVAGRVFLLLQASCPPGLEVFFAPLDWRPDRRTSLQPDLLVVRTDRIGEKNLTEPLELAVEVLSPSTRRKDMVLKHSKYAEADIGSYWVVDPQEPSITLWDLRDDGYVQVGHAAGEDAVTAQQPYPVTITPAALIGPRADRTPR